MKISLTYQTEVTVIVDLPTSTVESITVRKALGGPPTGIEGAIHINPIRQPADDPSQHPFTRDHERRAIHVICTTKHPKWTFEEPTT